MFFEPPPAREELTRPPHPPLPEWFAPPAAELGSSVVADRVLARSANVAVALSTVRAFSTGCVLNVEIVLRQQDMSPDSYWELQSALFPFGRVLSGGGRLPDRLLRFGVRYADGAKATTIGDGPPRAGGPPAAPQIWWMPSGGTMRSGQALAINDQALWLWPLPPAEPFELAVEWPLGGIGLTLAELDGGPIAAAARRSASYWPA